MKRDGITSLHGIHGYRHRTKPEKIRGRMINYSENRVWSPPRLISKYAPAFERPLPGVCQEIDGGGEWRRILECCCLENCFFFFLAESYIQCEIWMQNYPFFIRVQGR